MSNYINKNLIITIVPNNARIIKTGTSHRYLELSDGYYAGIRLYNRVITDNEASNIYAECYPSNS